MEKTKAEVLKEKWGKKLGLVRSSSGNLISEKNITTMERVRSKTPEIKKVTEFTKVKRVKDNFIEEWNDKTPKMYFKGFVRKEE